jgi:glycosyltransferase involved in cell wall biosynthesis
MKALFAHDHIFYKFEDSFYSNGGLSGNVLSRYTEVFGNLTVISRQVDISKYEGNLTLSSIDNTEFIKIPNFKSLSSILKYREAEVIIQNAVKNCDCLIARLPSAIGKIAVKYAKKYNKPYLIEVVGCAWDANKNFGSILGKIIAPYEFISNRFLIAKSQYTIYITKQFLQSRYPCKGMTVVCPNVNIEKVDPEVLHLRKAKINTQKDTIKFGLIGSLNVDYKGHETVIKALGLIKNQIPNFRVEFLGKGDPARWSQLIRSNSLEGYINFIGTLPSGNKVNEWLDTIDISLQPSKAEAQGRSIIEAMSRGCPIISTTVGGIVELIEGEWLVAPGDPQALAEKIVKIVSNKELQAIQAERNFNEAIQYYKDEIYKKRKGFLLEFKKSIEV